ncbi:hypothetical protein SAMN04488513_101605 [Pseudozobellia thermophila]|uniref:Uncharacterized protein n=2 Tax=Pseudozobellia thermophila TaxID=192903 RepID=A0A1M6C193_9FLAO|nr:hypothetical protein SAMN04488513_101605 [Pseudozobellia thermophila]
MKKCVIMFGLLVLTLVVAAVTDRNDREVAEELATNQEEEANIAFGQPKKESGRVESLNP